MPRVRIRLVAPKPIGKNAPKLDFETLITDLENIITPLITDKYGDEVQVRVESSSSNQIELTGFAKNKEEKPQEIVGQLLEQAYESLDMEKYQIYS